MSESTGLMAIIETSKGNIRLKLFSNEAPVTVTNFVNLAQNDFYKDLTFHRVIDDFMIQGGCPDGTGRGDPGYRFEDEVNTGLKHDRPGILSMANAGPGTNGSQFFITHVATPWLDGNHTIFGAVISDDDQTVVNDIRTGDQIHNIRIEGDASALLAANQDRIDEWNRHLKK